MADSISQLPAHSALPEPKLLFRGANQDEHPLRGLKRHGPYGAILGFPSQIRLAYFAAQTLMSRLQGLVRELIGTANPIEAKNYYIRYDGFASVFRIPLVPATDNLRCEAPDDCLALAEATRRQRIGRPHFSGGWRATEVTCFFRRALDVLTADLERCL
jgi:hypothetical protein